jgi:hypothetical protein
MTREERCLYLIDKGYTYNSQTGEVKNPQGKVLKSKDTKNYLMISHPITKQLFQHQFGWFYTYGEISKYLDHINGIKDDNRICNLRSVTIQQNGFNRPTSKGYSWDKQSNKWRSRIKLNGKLINLGYYQTEEEARQTYLNAKKIYHII